MYAGQRPWITDGRSEPNTSEKKTIPIKPERQVELEEFARRRGKTPADALDEALAQYLEWQKQDTEQAIEGIRRGYKDMKSGRTRPVESFVDDMRRKHDLSR